MYCGSCLRDNALAAALLARGHDVAAHAGLHADPHRRAQRQPRPGVLRRDQRLPRAAGAAVPAHAARLRSAVGRALGHPAGDRSGRSRSIPKSLGEMTVSMLRGEQGFQAKEIAKLLDWLRTEPRFDVVNLPYALLLGLAGPLRRELKAPICCTLQGEDLFLDGLGEPYRRESMALIRAASAARRRVPSRERVLPRLHARLSRGRRARRCGWCRSASTWRDYTPRPARARRRVHGRLSRADRAGEGAPSRCARPTARCAQREPSGASRLVAAGYLAPEHQPYLDEIQRKMREWGLGRRVRVPRRSRSRAEDRVPPERGRLFGARDLRRAEGHVPARGAGERRPGGAAAARRVSRDRRRRPAAACSWRSTTLRRSRTACSTLWRDPERAAALGRAGARRRAGALRRRPDGRGGRAGLPVHDRSALRTDRMRPTMLTVDRVTKRYRTPRGELCHPDRRLAVARARRRDRDHGTVRQRQEHAALYPGRARGRRRLARSPSTARIPYRLGEREQAAFRNQQIGFVFQDHSLLPQCSVLENVLAPTFVAPPADAGPADATPGAGAADPGRARRPARPSSGRAVGRRKAAGRARARADSQSDAAALRRADRQPRSCRGRHGGRPAARAACGPQHDPGRRDAQRRARRAFSGAIRDERRESGEGVVESQAPSSKSQPLPNAKSQVTPKCQRPIDLECRVLEGGSELAIGSCIADLGVEFWELAVGSGWDLELGIWDLTNVTCASHPP